MEKIHITGVRKSVTEPAYDERILFKWGRRKKNVGYLTYDSREVTEGTLFICKGAAFKAEYLDAAIEKVRLSYVSEGKI